MPSATVPSKIRVETITKRAFAPFGKAICHPGGRERVYLDAAFASGGDSRKVTWINNPPIVRFPLKVQQLEKHPETPQAFIPMHEAEYLAIACLSDADGHPALATLRAFLVSGPTAIIYAADTWHHGLLSSRDDTNFVVMMSRKGSHDDVIHTLETAMEIHND